MKNKNSLRCFELKCNQNAVLFQVDVSSDLEININIKYIIECKYLTGFFLFCFVSTHSCTTGAAQNYSFLFLGWLLG